MWDLQLDFHSIGKLYSSQEDTLTANEGLSQVVLLVPSQKLITISLLLQEDQRFRCEICSKSFIQRCDLARHLHIHRGTEPHRCPQCGKGYIRHSDLVTHQRFHNKEKPFACPHCSKGFCQRGNFIEVVKQFIPYFNLPSFTLLQVILIVISARFTCNSSQSFALIVTRSLRRKKHSYDTSILPTEINCWTINCQPMKCLSNFHFVEHVKPFWEEGAQFPGPTLVIIILSSLL